MNYYYEVTGIENSETSTNEKFQKIEVRIYYLLVISDKITKKIYTTNPATRNSAYSTIIFWEELKNGFPKLEIGDVIEGELIEVSDYNGKEFFLR
jgi:hypothetical protein